MPPLSIFDISGRAMSAQLVRLNTIASNLANAGSVAGTAEGVYQPRKPVFATMVDGASRATVDVERIVSGTAPPERRHEPSHPLANADGNVFIAPVDINQELVEMIETQRQYQNNIEVLTTAKGLMLETLRLGR